MMTTLPSHFHLQTAPIADPAAIVQAPHARFTLLTERLIRIEHSPSGEFEDHASQAFWFRRQAVPPFHVAQSADWLVIETEYLRLQYRIGAPAFSARALTILVKATQHEWRYGDKPWASQPLWGTTRTLDETSGAVHLEIGPMARAGWSVIDDSKSVVFNEAHWVQPRRHPENLDFYFFGYGHDYTACLRDYTGLCGPTPMIPRFILGNWWSRYWPYTQQELTGLMQEFQARQVPLSVCIVDMDWHLAGWTGYTWNRDLWPDPEGFVQWLHDMGLKTALNLHPSDGVGLHEKQYLQMAEALDQDPALEEPIKFDIANPRFAQAYFEILHHPYEKMGIDFWWMDWQQERVTGIPGLDPLWWLNHLHFLDLGREGKRPFVFSRWGGYGNHRYPIGFSGDTQVTWASLAYQPYFTATAANVAYGWWSHDIGGHMGGVEDDELYTRWVQFGAFSPILRMHSTRNPYHERCPWGRGPAASIAAGRALRLRHQLIPYIYSMAWRDHRQALPLITPMYYWNPEEDAAYHARDQYWFGSELVAAPFTAPTDAGVGMSRQRLWLPAGAWFDFFSGERIAGGDWRIVYGDLNDIPVFAKAGAIVPLAPETGWGGIDAPERLILHIFPGADNRFELYEDDGESQLYRQGQYTVTPLVQAWAVEGNALTLTVGPANGETRFVPERRTYQLIVHGIVQPDDVWVKINGTPRAVPWKYAPESDTLHLEIGNLRPGDQATLELGTDQTSLLSNRDRRSERVRRLLNKMPIDTWLKRNLDNALPDLLTRHAVLREFDGLSDAQMAALEHALRPSTHLL
ncbi:MAG: TIM-barrel domain-containing protein [Chloroflexota bacterium]